MPETTGRGRPLPAPFAATRTITLDAIRIGGLTPLSSLDYPGTLAAVVYCQGCPWDCPYCQNAALRPRRGEDERSPDDVLTWLHTRRGLLDAVVFSGGEPTLHQGLHAMMDAVRALDFAVGLHTAGMFPEALAPLLPGLAWVGLDIKAPLPAYDRLTGTPGSGKAAFASLELVRQNGLPFEVRTTWHPAVLAEAELETLAATLDSLATDAPIAWFLQPFRPEGCARADLVQTGSVTVPEALLARLGALAPRLTIAVR